MLLATTDKSLTQILAELGIRHEATEDYAARALYRGETLIGFYDCRKAVKLARRVIIQRALAA